MYSISYWQNFSRGYTFLNTTGENMNTNPLKYDKLIALKITQEDYDFLQRYSKGEKISVSEVLRKSIQITKEKIWDEIYELEQKERDTEYQCS